MRLGAGLALTGALALAACAPQTSPDAFDPSRPLSKGYVQIVSAGPRLVEVEATGRRLRAPAPEGLCIPLESVQTARGAAFFLLADCPGAAPTPGVLTVSIGGDPAPVDLAALERRLGTEAGIVGLGYGGYPGEVSLLALERGPGVLFAVVEDRSEFGPAFAGDLIVRAFAEVNGRLVIATLLSRRDEPAEAAAMQARLAALVAALNEASA